MASPAYINRGSDEIKLGPGPQIFALKFATGKNVQSKFPGGRVMFTAVDDRKLWLNDEDANEFEHALADLEIQPAEFIRVSRITHGRGGGFAIRVERVDDRDPDPQPPARPMARAAVPSRIEAQLEKSVEMARQHGAAAFTPEARRAAPSTERTAPTQREAPGNNDETRRPSNGMPATASSATMTGLAAGALMASIDAYTVAVDYAISKGIKVTMELDFNAEDVRQTATSMLIQYWRDGGTR